MFQSDRLKQIAGYIDGNWAGTSEGRARPVRNPATGDVLAHVPEMTEENAQSAIDAAERAMDKDFALDQRRDCLNAIAHVLEIHSPDLARIITAENGKPLKEASAEVAYAASFFSYFAGQLDCLKPSVLPDVVRNCRWSVFHRPAGVVGLITPWNFPLAMLAKKLAAAIGAGCASVTKPAPNTPLTAIALWSLLDSIKSLPHGMANLIIGPAEPIGAELCRHPAVRLISFTGSTRAGQWLMEQCAKTVKRLSLELGGNAPFIVCEDADLASAADHLIANKFRASGQTCVCANRVYVHAHVNKQFTHLVSERVARLRVGNGADPDVDLGPLNNRAAFDKVAQHVADALKHGARCIIGSSPNRPANDWGAFHPPVVIADVSPEMLICREETFGPVIAIGSYEDEATAIELANSTPYGLAAYVFTASTERFQGMQRRLCFGHIGWNTGVGPVAQAPFGGLKMSGFGREGGTEGLMEFCDTQVVAQA